MDPNGFQALSIDREVESRGQRDRPHHPDGILSKAHLRVADRPHQARAEIGEAINVVDDRESRDVVKERVDREVAAKRILFRRAERVVVMNQAVLRGVSGRRIIRTARCRRGRQAGTPSSTTSSPAASWRRNVATSITFCRT